MSRLVGRVRIAGLAAGILVATSIGCQDKSATNADSTHDHTKKAIPSDDAGKSKPDDESTADADRNDATSGDKQPAESNEALEPQPVLLGTSELVGGIPGNGPLTTEQIEAWLDNRANHAPLAVALPLGLAKGASQIQVPQDNVMTRAKIELGRQLYFDKRLSADNTISCASCHEPGHGYAAATQFGVGIRDQTGNRNSPVAYNRILSGAQFWDGRAASLEAQAVGPIANPIEMGNTHDAAVETVASIPGYKMQFDAIFPGEGVTIDTIGKSIATFERAIVTGPAPYDYYEPLAAFEKAYADDLEDLDTLKEEDEETYNEYTALKQAAEAHPMSESAVRGSALFFGDRGGCTACHVGANFADEKYHNLGVGMDAAEPDLGRFAETKNDADRGAFKTPTIRNVAQTGPYMHDGSQKTLAEVVDWYNKGGHPNEHLSKDIKKLDLNDTEKQDLVAFMEALTGALPKVEQGRLPE